MIENRIKVQINNWQNGTLQDLLNFLSRNARINLQNATIEGQFIIGYVNTTTQANQLKKWNGAKFARNNLKIDILDGNNNTIDGSNTTSTTIQLLKNVLAKRYNVQSKMLDLSNLVTDPDLINNGMFNNAARQAKILPAILKVATNEKTLIVESINLANNNLKDILPISNLPLVFKDLKNLCLANNNFARFQSFNSWKGKFTQLRELLMINNPLVNDRIYRTEMLTIFPKLIVLDNVIVRDQNKLKNIFTINPINSNYQQFFFENQDLSNFATEFISNYLNLWDTVDPTNNLNYNRSQLLNLYTPQSQFSISVDSSVPSSTVDEADQTPQFGYYLSTSRNFTKVSTPKLLQERLAIGQEAINNLFNSIPKTKHSLIENPNNYSVEAITFPQVNGFAITLHGVFEEVAKPFNEDNSNNNLNNKKQPARHRRYNNSSTTTTKKLSRKSFDRTWVVINNAATNSIIIASDLLTIRTYAAGPWKPKEVIVPAAPTVVPLSQPANNQVNNPINNSGSITPQSMNTMGNLQLPPDIQAKLNPGQLDLLNKIQLQTRLNSEYTYMLAEQSGWNYDAALSGFQSSVSNLPPNAFIQ